MKILDFWFEFASSYSYLAAMRAESLAQEAEIVLRWRPFLLGPIFAAQGWTTSPFNLYPAKGRYMWRDLDRICAARGLALVRPEPFPQNSLLAARLALSVPETLLAPFSRAVYRAEYGEGRSIADKDVLTKIVENLGLAAAALFERAQSEEIKTRLRRQTQEAQDLGVFGAPTFVAPDGELFWGDDRLEPAIAWTRALG